MSETEQANSRLNIGALAKRYITGCLDHWGDHKKVPSATDFKGLLTGV